MSKLRRLMNRLSHGALSSVAALALTVTATNKYEPLLLVYFRTGKVTG